MSEQLLPPPAKVELLSAGAEGVNIERPPEKPENSESIKTEQHTESVETLSLSAETQAVAAAEVSFDAATEQQPTHTFGAHQQLKNDAYERTLNRARHSLTSPERALSKLIHAKAIESATEISSKTIGRASGILSGACFTLIGTALLLYASNHYGYIYNYSVFFILFAIGFIVGTAIELACNLLIRKKI